MTSPQPTKTTMPPRAFGLATAIELWLRPIAGVPDEPARQLFTESDAIQILQRVHTAWISSGLTASAFLRLNRAQLNQFCWANRVSRTETRYIQLFASQFRLLRRTRRVAALLASKAVLQ